MPTVSVFYSNMSKGRKVVVPQLGTFPNGETSEVSQAALDRYLRVNPNASQYVVDGTLQLGAPVAQQVNEPEPEPEPEPDLDETDKLEQEA